MKQMFSAERFYLVAHILAMAFGLAGLLVVLPHPELISGLSNFGQTLFEWGMSGGGVFYILLGAIAVSLYARRTLGNAAWFAFLLPSVFLSLTSELLGTSTGFPFGDYSYLSGLGYKIAGLVPFTIPLSWFYLGFVSYVMARAGLEPFRKQGESGKLPGWLVQGLSIALGSLLLMSWDFVLDPAMSQTSYPFWYWHQPGAFFGMPYQNFLGWFGTGAVFMTVAALIWERMPHLKDLFQQKDSKKPDLTFPLIVYISDFTFATVLSLAAGLWIPVVLGVFVGVLPAVSLCWLAWSQASRNPNEVEALDSIPARVSGVVSPKTAPTSVKVSSKL
ncbi:MAG: carotenoid biosynthesis protein [Leptolyngbyaceae cyanobacterium bins.59]|nr:carotenoid biosynthesis protein [Leptolyngbyaceae cyanobacterium bins.59]